MNKKEKAVWCLICGLVIGIGDSHLQVIIPPEMAKKILFFLLNIAGIYLVIRGTFFWRDAENEIKKELAESLHEAKTKNQ